VRRFSVSDSTQPPTVVDQHVSAIVIPLFTEVVLDDGAIQAERLALLAEIVAEQFSNPGPAPVDGGGRSARLAAARHAECVAHLARVAADRERARCVGAHCGPAAGDLPSGIVLEPV
jgi:hypothetical protein